MNFLQTIRDHEKVFCNDTPNHNLDSNVQSTFYIEQQDEQLKFCSYCRCCGAIRQCRNSPYPSRLVPHPPFFGVKEMIFALVERAVCGWHSRTSVVGSLGSNTDRVNSVFSFVYFVVATFGGSGEINLTLVTIPVFFSFVRIFVLA